MVLAIFDRFGRGCTRGVARFFSQGGGGMCFPGGPVVSEEKRDRARHAQRAERSGGLQGGLGALPPAGFRGGAPAGNFAKIEVF